MCSQVLSLVIAIGLCLTADLPTYIESGGLGTAIYKETLNVTNMLNYFNMNTLLLTNEILFTIIDRKQHLQCCSMYLFSYHSSLS